MDYFEFKDWMMEEEVRHKSVGVLNYGTYPKVVLNIDKDIAAYYRSLIPKVQSTAPDFALPMYAPHITVVRIGKETPSKENWGKYEGEKVPFEYENYVYSDNLYFWLNAYSTRLEDIREEMGLPRIRIGYNDFHITIANKKGLYGLIAQGLQPD